MPLNPTKHMKNLKSGKVILTCLLILFIGKINAQTTNDHVNSLRTKIEAAKTHIQNNEMQKLTDVLEQIKLDLEQFKAYEAASVDKVQTDLNQVINKLKAEAVLKDQTISDLTKQLQIARTDKTNEILKFVEAIIRERDNSQQILQQSTKDKEELQLKYDNLIKTKETLVADNTLLNSEVQRLKDKNIELSDKLETYSSSVKLGLSIGFNYYWNNQVDYIVQANSKVKESGSPEGMSGIISGVVIIRLSKKNKFPQHNAVINIPLGDFTSGSDRAVGIFNNRIAVGLGYSLTPFENAPSLSFTAIFNVSPYQKIDYDLIKDINFNLPTFTKLKPDDYGATTAVSGSFTIGIVYSFINAGGRGK
jgi:hypothetical protein